MIEEYEYWRDVLTRLYKEYGLKPMRVKELVEKGLIKKTNLGVIYRLKKYGVISKVGWGVWVINRQGIRVVLDWKEREKEREKRKLEI